MLSFALYVRLLNLKEQSEDRLHLLTKEIEQISLDQSLILEKLNAVVLQKQQESEFYAYILTLIDKLDKDEDKHLTGN